MSCHLESTSFPLPNAILRYDRGPFTYRPGEPLEAYMLNFDHAPGTGREEKFEIVNAAYRLRRSACFLKSTGKMLCTTCHNPHDAPRGEAAERHYTAVCRQCHGPAFDQQVAAGKHTRANGCAACHMPKRHTEDVVNVAVTDHFIQRQKPAGDLGRKGGKAGDGRQRISWSGGFVLSRKAASYRRQEPPFQNWSSPLTVQTDITNCTRPGSKA